MNYCGLDLGKKSSNFCIVNEKRETVREGKVRNRLAELTKRFGEMPPMRIVIEASSKAFWIADRLGDMGHELIVVDPGRTKAIGSALIKHDKLDAKILAILCAADVLAVVDQPTEKQRMARMPVVARDVIIRSRVRMVVTVRSLLDSEGIELKKCALDKFVDAVSAIRDEIPQELFSAIEPILSAIEMLTEQIRGCDSRIRKTVSKDEDAKLLMSAPGVGPVVSMYFLMAIRDPHRFSSARSVGSYLGLVPSLYQSGQIRKQGRITKHGNRQARWALCCAANRILQKGAVQNYALREWGLKLVEKHGRKKAVTAVARKLSNILWAMWKNKTAFDFRLANAA